MCLAETGRAEIEWRACLLSLPFCHVCHAACPWRACHVCHCAILPFCHVCHFAMSAMSRVRTGTIHARAAPRSVPLWFCAAPVSPLCCWCRGARSRSCCWRRAPLLLPLSFSSGLAHLRSGPHCAPLVLLWFRAALVSRSFALAAVLLL